MISSITEITEPTAGNVLGLLVEAEVLTALSTAEVVKTKLEAIRVLERAVEPKTLENSLRNHIAANPYILIRSGKPTEWKPALGIS